MLAAGQLSLYQVQEMGLIIPQLTQKYKHGMG
ncbi:hypothetical protein vBKpnAMK6_00439 [Klebsiella phage vB_Kpn_AM_K6]